MHPPLVSLYIRCPPCDEKVDQTLLQTARNAFAVDIPGEGHASSGPSRTFAQDFGARRLERDKEIIDMPEGRLIPAWETCVQNALRAKVAVEDEVAKGTRANVGDPNYYLCILTAGGVDGSFEADI